MAKFKYPRSNRLSPLRSFAALTRKVFSIDLRALALFRIGLSLLVLANLFILAFDLTDFYTDNGIMPLRLWPLATDRWHWSLYASSGQLWFQILLFCLSACIAILFAIGYRTRLMSVLTWVLLVSLVNRNHFVLQAGDQLLVALSFWAMFLPLNARYSVDAALDSRYQHNPNAADNSSNQYFSIATVAVILQVLYLYFFTAILKTDDAWRVSMDAAFYAVNLEHFATPVAVFMRDFPALLSFSTGYVLLVEFIAPLLALSPFLHAPLRLIAVALLYSLHIAFLLMLHIGLFPFIDFVALLLLIPTAAWNWISVVKWRFNKDNIRIYYDQDCGFCKKTTLIFREFFLHREVPIIPAQSDATMGAILERENSWIVTNGENQQYLHWHAVQFVIGRSFWFKPIAWVMGVPALMRAGNRLYAKIGSNRTSLSALSARFLPYVKLNTKPSLLAQLIAVFFLYAVTVTNIASVSSSDFSKPEHVARSIKLARLDQRWGMFAPKPLVYSVHPVVAGTLRDGSSVDVFNNRHQAPDWTPPEYGYSAYPGYRWRKVFERVDGNTARVRNAYADFLCRRWNQPTLEKAKQLAKFEIFSVRSRTNTEGKPKKITRQSLWRHWCYPEFAPDS